MKGREAPRASVYVDSGIEEACGQDAEEVRGLGLFRQLAAVRSAAAWPVGSTRARFSACTMQLTHAYSRDTAPRNGFRCLRQAAARRHRWHGAAA